MVDTVSLTFLITEQFRLQMVCAETHVFCKVIRGVGGCASGLKK